MGKLIVRWVLLVVSIWVASIVTQALGLKFEVDYGTVERTISLFAGAALLALVNATLGRILRILTIPLNCATLGLFSLVVNALMLWLVASMDIGLHIDAEGWPAFLAAFAASLLISIINSLLGTFLGDQDDKEKDD